MRPHLKPPTIAVLAAALLATAVFAQTIGFDFTNWDDTEYVVANPILVSGKVLRMLDPETTTADAWTPLTGLTYALERSVGGLEPALYHTTNVLMHAICAGLVAALLLGTGLPPAAAFVGAALFAVHPLQVESVAWVSGRKNLLSTLLLLLALLQLRRSGTRAALVGTLLGAAALLAKPTAVVIVPLALLDRLRVAPGDLRPALLRIAPLAVIAVALGLLAVHQQEAARANLAAVPLVERVLTMGRMTIDYGRHLLLPTNLAANYPVAPVDGWEPSAVLATTLVVALFGLTAWRLRRSRAALFLLAWIPVAGFPHSNLIAGPFWMADRYTYLAIVGVGGLVALAAQAGIARGRTVRYGTIAAVGLGFLSLSALSVQRSEVWRSSFTLWEDTLRKAPDFAEGHLNLGTASAGEDRHEEAAAAYRRALEIRPTYEAANTSLANELDALGDRDSAKRLYARSLELDPESPSAHYNLGLVLQEEGRLAEARTHYQKTLSAEPRNWLAWNNLGNTLRDLGDEDGALEAYEQALDANSGYGPAWINLGDTYRRVGNLDRAEHAYLRGIAADPESAQAHYGMAATHAARGQLLLARDRLREVLALEPDLEVARRALTQIEAKLAGH